MGAVADLAETVVNIVPEATKKEEPSEKAIEGYEKSVGLPQIYYLSTAKETEMVNTTIADSVLVAAENVQAPIEVDRFIFQENDLAAEDADEEAMAVGEQIEVRDPEEGIAIADVNEEPAKSNAEGN